MRSTKSERFQCAMSRFASNSLPRTHQCSLSHQSWKWCSAPTGKSVRAHPSLCTSSLRNSRMTLLKQPQLTLTRRPNKGSSAACSSSNTTLSRRFTIKPVKSGRVLLTIRPWFWEQWLTAAFRWSSRLFRVTRMSCKTWVLPVSEASLRRWARSSSWESSRSSVSCSNNQLKRISHLVCADFCTALLALPTTDFCKSSAPSLLRF